VYSLDMVYSLLDIFFVVSICSGYNLDLLSNSFDDGILSLDSTERAFQSSILVYPLGILRHEGIVLDHATEKVFLPKIRPH